MSEFTDITVETQNPEMLDQTVQQLGTAVVVEGSFNGTTCTVRVFGDPGFVTFAITNQGYGKIVEEEGPLMKSPQQRAREILSTPFFKI